MPAIKLVILEKAYQGIRANSMLVPAAFTPVNMEALCVQKWDVYMHPMVEWHPATKYVLLYQKCQNQLLSAPKLEFLSLRISAHRPPVLRELPLRHLELLMLVKDETPPWLADCLEDLRHIMTLESLTIRAAMDTVDFGSAPNMHLEGMRNLRHVKLVWLLPTETFSLPRGCLLHLDARCLGGRSEWVNHSKAIEQHTSVLYLFGFFRSAWPARIRQFSNLQCLALQLPQELFQRDMHPGFLDVADLQHIPHLRLHDSSGVMSLKITGGSWQSLEIAGVQGLEFADIDAFLKGTTSFTFDFRENREAEGALAVLCSACHRNDVQYYHCSATAISTARVTVQAYAEHAGAMVERSEQHLA